MKKSKKPKQPYISPIPLYPMGGTYGSMSMPSLGWLGYAEQASQLGKSMIPKDQYGNPVQGYGQAADEIITADHDQMIKDLQNRQYGKTIVDSTGLGKFGRMASELTGNTGATSGFWGLTNKLAGTPNYVNGIDTNKGNGFLDYSQSNTITPSINDVPIRHSNTYASGGWIQHAVNPNHKGFCTPITKSTCTPHRKALAMTFKKHHGFHKAEGGLINNWSEDQYINLAAPIVYANGGLNPMPNAQLEKEEVMQFPNGSTAQVDAPTHQNGGINLNLPEQTKIYSDRLKASTGKTFAKEAEQFKNNKWEKILNDKNSDDLRKKTAQMMFDKNQSKLDDLFMEQEQQKQERTTKAFNRFMKKHGGEMPLFCSGGMMKYPYGGIAKFDGGGEFNTWFAANKDNPVYKTYSMDQMRAAYNNQSEPVDNTDYFMASINANRNYNPDYSNQQIYNVNTNPNTNMGPVNPYKSNDEGSMLYANSGTPTSSNNPNGNWYQRNKSSVNEGIFQGANFLAQNIGNLLYLKDQGKKYDKVNYGRVNPSLLDPTEALKDIDRSSYSVQKMIPSSTGGHGGQAINALTANAANRENLKQKTRLDYANANAGINNQFSMYNKGLEVQGMNDEARNKGAALKSYYDTWSDIGYKSAGQSKDIQDRKAQDYNLKVLSDYLNNLEFDKVTGKYKFKKG